MSNALDKAISETRSRSHQLVELAKAAAASAPSGGGMLNYGGYGGTAIDGNAARVPTMQTHAEQYRHYNGWVYAAIRPIGERIAGQPFRVARRAKPGKKRPPGRTRHFKIAARSHNPDRKPVRPTKESLPRSFKQYSQDLDVLDDHPLIDAIEKPNPIMVRWQLFNVTLANLFLTGKAFWWVRQPEPGEDLGGPEGEEAEGRIEIWPVPSSWIEPKHTAERLFDHWQLRPGGYGEKVDIPREEIAYIYEPDPANPMGAISRLSAQARAVVADEAIAEAQRRSFTNGVFPGLAVVVGRHPDIRGNPGERPFLTKEQKSQIIHALKQAYRGVLGYDEPFILDGMIEDVKRITNTNKEMDFINSGKYTKSRIVQGFGTNPIIMGEIEGANRASAIAADEHQCQWTVNPIIELFSQCLTAWVQPAFADDGEELIAYLEPAHADDPDLKMNEEKMLSSIGGMKVNEVRTRHGLAPLDPEDGDVVWVPSGMVKQPIRLVGEPKQAMPPPAAPPGAAGGAPAPAGAGTPQPAAGPQVLSPRERAGSGVETVGALLLHASNDLVKTSASTRKKESSWPYKTGASIKVNGAAVPVPSVGQVLTTLEAP
jgi:phage portal protein BeeE